MTAQRQRTRLSPQARREQLLATAKQMIVEDGLQSFTIESLARVAEVSSPLVYNYFSSRQELLQGLLTLEHQGYADHVTEQIRNAEDFTAVIRIFIVSNFDYYAPGNILPILQSQPEIASAIKKARRKNEQDTAKYLVQKMARTYRLTKAQAELAVSMSSGASIAAAEYNARKRGNRNQAIDSVLAYVLAGLNHLSAPEE